MEEAKPPTVTSGPLPSPPDYRDSDIGGDPDAAGWLGDTFTCIVKSRTPAALMSRVRLFMKAMKGMDSSCSSGKSRTSIAANTGCCNSSLRQCGSSIT